MDNLRCISDNLTQTDDQGGEPLEQPVGRRGLLRFGASGALIGAAAAIVERSPAGAAARPGLHAATNASRAIDARQDGSGDAIYSHIENASNPSRAVFGRTVGTGIAIVGSIAERAQQRHGRQGNHGGLGARGRRLEPAGRRRKVRRCDRADPTRAVVGERASAGGARRGNSSSTTRADSGSVAAAPTGSNWPRSRAAIAA